MHQTFSDEDGDRDFGIRADVDLDATQEEGEAVFANYRVGSIEDLMDDAGEQAGSESSAEQAEDA